jgi:phosphoenolpyruvate carboxylase
MTETPPPSDAALRRDIREPGDVLGATITRQEGRAVFDLVERVRGLVRTARAAAATLQAGVDPVTATTLVRALATFFHLAVVAEQVDRARALQARRRWTARCC